MLLETMGLSEIWPNHKRRDSSSLSTCKQKRNNVSSPTSSISLQIPTPLPADAAVMNSKAKFLASLTKSHLHHFGTIAKVRLKWVKNRSLDHIIDVQTDIKAASLIKDAIVRSSTGYLTTKSLEDSHKLLGLTVPTLRFVRRYPTLFEEYPHPKYPSLACFKLAQLGKIMQEREIKVFEECEGDIVERLCRLLMMTRNKMVKKYIVLLPFFFSLFLSVCSLRFAFLFK